MLYNPDGTVAHKKFDKTIVSENEWHYEAWFPTAEDYYIIETVPDGFTAYYKNVGTYADVTDRCYNGGTIINYKVPSTGDRTDLRLWIAVLLIAFGGMCGIVGLAKRKKA